MTAGEGFLIFGGVVVVAGAAYLALRANPASSAAAAAAAQGVQPLYATNPQLAYAQPTPPGAPPPAPSATNQLLSGVNALNQAGCQVAASKIGAGSLGAIGCSAFLKYATPLGVAEVVNTQLVKIPGVATAENAVSSVANKSVKAVKGAVSTLLSIF